VINFPVYLIFLCITGTQDLWMHLENKTTVLQWCISLLFVIPAFGGTVSLEGKGVLFDESDQSITQQVCDLAYHLLCEITFQAFLLYSRKYYFHMFRLLTGMRKAIGFNLDI